MGQRRAVARLSVWQPIPAFPVHVPVNPDANVYGVALLLAFVSGLLFGGPVRQVLRTDPYEMSNRATGARRPADYRSAICCWSCRLRSARCWSPLRWSPCAVWCARCTAISVLSLSNALLVNTDLSMAGYRGERCPTMQKRMLDALGAIPGVDLRRLDW